MIRNNAVSRRRFLAGVAASTGTLLFPARMAATPEPASPLVTAAPLEALTAELDGLVPQLLASNLVPGLSMALIRDGDVAWTGAWGRRSASTGEPAETTTLFEAASLSKPLFATGVMTLVEEGRLSLDEPVGRYLNEPFAEDPELRAKIDGLTPRLILSHRTGLPNWRHPDGLVLLREPDTQWGYSGEGYVLLQRVVESITGMAVEAFLRERVIGPLGMERSVFIWNSEADGPAAESHSFKGESRGKTPWPEANVASSLHTTPAEFARFMTLFMDPRRSSNAIVKAETLERMLKPATDVGDEAVEGRIAWGLGWGLQESADGRAFWHWGSNRGFKAFAIGYPEQGVGAVVFTNADLGWKLHREILPRVLGGDPTALMWRF